MDLTRNDRRITRLGLASLKLPRIREVFLTHAMDTTMPMLRELVLVACQVPRDLLTLRAIPKSVATLKMSSVELVGDKGDDERIDMWFFQLLRDRDVQKRPASYAYGGIFPCRTRYVAGIPTLLKFERSNFVLCISSRPHALSYLEWRTHCEKVKYLTYAISSSYLSPPLRLQIQTHNGEKTSVFYQQETIGSYKEDFHGKITAVNTIARAVIDESPGVNGLVWELQSDGFSTFTLLQMDPGGSNDGNTSVSILLLPDEMLVMILKLLDVIDLCAMACTCQRIRKLSAHVSPLTK